MKTKFFLKRFGFFPFVGGEQINNSTLTKICKNMTTQYLRKSVDRLPWAIAVCLTLATLGLGLSASANERETCFTTFDAPGAGTGPFQGTVPFCNNPPAGITGYYIDASNVGHGFLVVGE